MSKSLGTAIFSVRRLGAALIGASALFLAGCGAEAGDHGHDDHGDPAPPAPSELSAMPVEGGVHLTWKDNSTNEESFVVMRKHLDDDDAYAQIGRTRPNVTSLHDPSATTPHATYSYVVHALSGEMASSPSNDAIVTLP
jgi:hypothetical protein